MQTNPSLLNPTKSPTNQQPSSPKSQNLQKYPHRRIQTQTDQPPTCPSSTNQQNPLPYPQQPTPHHYYTSTFYKNKLGSIDQLPTTQHLQNNHFSHQNNHTFNYNHTSNKTNNNINANSSSALNANVFNNTQTSKKQIQQSSSHPNLAKKSYKKISKPPYTRYYLNTQGNNQQQDKTTLKKYKTNPTFNPNMSLNSKYQLQGIAGKGTFGVVYYCRALFTGQKLALKKVLQDRKYKNRQLDIMKQIHHPNLLQMKDYFFTTQGPQQYLNVVMDYYSDNLYQIIKKKQLTPLLIKIYTYQILRGLNYLANFSIAHRDIKPQNILIDRTTHKLVICDFGSAKKLIKGQLNISYICSRCYRAPQLIFGATQYTPQIDMWSLGCVLVQMINGQVPFLGDSQIDQLFQIMKILGTPQKTDIQQMNSKYNITQLKKFPKIKSIPLKKIIDTQDPLLLDLLSKILEYSPEKRYTPLHALQHEYFHQLTLLSTDKDKDYLRKMKIKTLPELFNYTQNQIQHLPSKSTQQQQPKPKTYKQKIKSSLFHHPNKTKQSPSTSQLPSKPQKSLTHVSSQGRQLFITQYNEPLIKPKQYLNKKPQNNTQPQLNNLRALKLNQKRNTDTNLLQNGNRKTNQQFFLNSTDNITNYPKNSNYKNYQYQ